MRLPTYVELHNHTFYSLLDGASPPEVILDRAVELGMDSLAITDHNGLYGAVNFWLAAKERGIKPIIGAELTLDGDFHLVLLAKNQMGYNSLCRLISYAQLSHRKGEASLSMEVLREYAHDLVALSGCRKGDVASYLIKGKRKEAYEAAIRYASIFGEGNFYIELQNHLLPDDAVLCGELVELADRLGLPYVATNNVHYALRDGHELQDLLVCIKEKITVEESSEVRKPNSEYFVKSYEEVINLFQAYPEAISNTVEIATRCEVDLNLKEHRFPSFSLPEGETASSYLEKLCREGVRRKYDPPRDRAWKQLEHELSIIRQMKLETYFLTVWDIMRFAKERGIPAQGRGSAANSLVAYVLDITKVDPLRYNFLFERFLNPQGSSTPDIDIDFSTNHREEVISYVYERYGQDHAGMVCTYYTFNARQAIRDVGKALGFPKHLLDRLAKSVDRWTEDLSQHIIEEMDLKGMERSLPWRKFISLCNQIMHYPRHLGIHVGGMVITSQPLAELVPLERATMPGRVVTQLDKEWIEEVGLIKIDLLSLRTLSLIHDALEMIEENHAIRIEPEKVPLDDPLVFETLRKGDSIGMFQVESRAQRNTLPRLRPEKFEDLIVEVALIRPGPLQGNMVHPYLRRRQGQEKVTYLHPSLKPILQDTMGIIVFQEQVMQVAMAIAGFSAAEADSLRRAMSSKRSRWEMEKLRQRFMEGARGKRVEEKIATEIFRQIAGFAEFGFCRSHAAAFAQTAYLTAWLKVYYPAEFYCALLNNQPMGFYHVSVVTNDAKRHGVEILPVDVNRSEEKCTTEEGNVRIGLTYVHGLGEKAAGLIVEERDNGPYRSLRDFYGRTRCKRRPLENLIMVGAMDDWQTPRRELLWELGMIHDEREEGKGQRRLELVFPSQRVKLSPLSGLQETVLDYTILGLTTSDRQHPMCFFRGSLKERGAVSTAEIEELPHNLRVKIAGLVVVKQSPATAGDLLFVTLEDEFGLVDVIVWAHIWKRYRRLIQRSAILMVEGTLQKQGKLVSILAKRLEQVEEVPVEQREVSRNFR